MYNFTGTSMINMAAIIAEHLAACEIKVVLVGGLAVEVYTNNIYLTQDIDMVNTNLQPPAKLHKAMAALGFQKQGRVYVNPTTEVTVEFPSAPLSVGDELVRNTTTIEVQSHQLPILYA